MCYIIQRHYLLRIVSSTLTWLFPILCRVEDWVRGRDWGLNIIVIKCVMKDKCLFVAIIESKHNSYVEMC